MTSIEEYKWIQDIVEGLPIVTMAVSGLGYIRKCSGRNQPAGGAGTAQSHRSEGQSHCQQAAGQ